MENQAKADARQDLQVVELREYTLHPGARETLIAVFDRHLVEAQEETGMTVIGQFRDPDRPDRFVWLRGFDNMETRKDALAAFYGGPVWAAHKDAANATMIAFDNVLLLRPAWAGTGFDLTGRARGRPAAQADVQDDEGAAVLVTIHHVQPDASADFAAIFHDEALPLLSAFGAPPAATLVSEHAENTFPRLPVREGENALVTVQEFADIAGLGEHRKMRAANAAWDAVEARLARHRSRAPLHLRLLPTARSLLAGR